MRAPIPEADWKLLRSLHPVALDRYCERVLEEVRRIAADTQRSQHQRYLAVFQLMQERNRTMALAFDDMRRSTAIQRIMHMQHLGLLLPEEFARFSDQTRDVVQLLLD